MLLIQSFRRIFFIIGLTILSGCSVYKSPDRKDFDSLVVAQNFAKLKVVSCSSESIKEFATEASLLSAETSLNNSLWQYRINDDYFIESDTLEGAYCLYESI